jgi:hypothetical protein
MNIKVFISSFFIIILLSLFFFRTGGLFDEAMEVEAPGEKVQSHVSVPSSPAALGNKIEVKNALIKQKSDNFNALNEREENAENLSILFKKYSLDEEVSSAELLADLDSLELEPLRSLQETGSGGNMATVRTKSSLKGTRYFHAQFFTDENGKEYLQHMSFEMGPKEPFERVRELAKAYLSAKVISEISKPNYQLWKMDNGYNVWVKTLSKEELQGDPFNAYSASDVGTKRIVIEEEIHPDQDEHKH